MMATEPSRHGDSPTGFYAITFVLHIIAYITMVVAAFLPKWATVTEQLGPVDFTYNRGVLVTCAMPDDPNAGCHFHKDVLGSSAEFQACFFLMVFSLLTGFVALTLMMAGACLPELRVHNLGISLMLSILLYATLSILSLILFEASVAKDVTQGYSYADSSFGLARILLVAAICLAFLAAFFALGEYFKRKEQRETNDYKTFKNSKRPAKSRSVTPVTSTQLQPIKLPPINSHLDKKRNDLYYGINGDFSDSSNYMKSGLPGHKMNDFNNSYYSNSSDKSKKGNVLNMKNNKVSPSLPSEVDSQRLRRSDYYSSFPGGSLNF